MTDPSIDIVLQRVRLIFSEHLGLPLERVRSESRTLEDLNCDSLDLVEIIMEIEEAFGVSLPVDSDDPIYKAVFARRPFRVATMAELVVHQLRNRPVAKRIEWLSAHAAAAVSCEPFTQGGALYEPSHDAPLYEPVGATEGGYAMLRRRTDGMRCVIIPGAVCQIGQDDAEADERPRHSVRISPFVIDCEPVSVCAYCLFLNNTGVSDVQVLRDLFVTSGNDHRIAHVPVVRADGRWHPRTPGSGTWPMIMVSWFGANAYSRWANRLDWREYKQRFLFAPGRSTLPSEAQWEYASRGPIYREYPWGSECATPALAHYGLHQRHRSYRFDELPIAPVNARLGVSPFGLFHMAGNVWQWCSDAYSPDFYRRQEAMIDDPLNDNETGNRSERGGSWIGSAALLRSSYRRGREPFARGRCLGFRCTGAAPTY